MGKRSSNPADAFRKAQKARELKKNKEQRKKARDDQAVRQDTRDLETQIASLKSVPKRDEQQEQRLKALEKEMKHVSKLKEKYVAAHPEAKDRVYHTGKYKPREQRDDDGEPAQDPMAHLYNPDGTLRDPKRSVYYDPTYNPFGVPPPGMPYRERSPSDDESSDEDSDDSDVVMPEGPPPGESDDDSDDSDDIPLPPGPPPPRPGAQAHPPFPTGGAVRPPPFRPPGFRPPGFRPPGFNARPPVQRPPPSGPESVGWGPLMDEPKRPPPSAGLPPKPTGLPVRPNAPPGLPGSLPARPEVSAQATVSATPAAAVISSAPQLRDLRKETTVFVPRGLAKKKATAPGGVTVNATPGSGTVDAEGDQVRPKAAKAPGLMDKLSDVLGKQSVPATDADEDEYERFLAGLEK